jgi:signal transduction histidine kinase
MQVVWVVLVRRGVDVQLVAGLSIVFDSFQRMSQLPDSIEPGASSSSMVFFVVLAAYFLPARLTIAYATLLAGVLTWMSYQVDAWNPSTALPSSAQVVLSSGLVLAFIMSRVRRTESELQDIARRHLMSLRRIEQVDASRHRLIANVSHELRTPLTATIGAIETMRRDDVPLTDAQRERLLEIASSGGLRLLSLVEDLLTIGTTRPDSIALSTDPLRLSEIARDAIVGIDPGEDRDVIVNVIADPWIRADRMRLMQVTSNLVVNAVRHGAGDIVVETDLHDDHARLRVLDSGPGITPDHVDELFLPFAKFSARRDSTGLGLAICRTLVEAHAGTISYERVEDRLTAFTVDLPVFEPAQARAR